MKKTIILAAAMLAAVVLYVYGKIDYEHIVRQWDDTSLAKLKAEGNAMLQRGQMDSALILYTIAGNKYDNDMDDEDKTLCATALNNAGYIYTFHLNNYSAAYSSLLKAQHIAEDAGLKDILPTIYLNIGNIYTTYYDNDTAIKQYKKAFHTSIEAKDWEILLTTFTNLVGTAIQEKRIKDVRNEVYTFKRTSIPSMPMLAYSRSIGAAAEALLEGRGDSAVAYIRKAVTQVDTNLKPERFRLFTEMLVAIIHEGVQRYDEALAVAMDVERKSRKETSDIQEQTRFVISELYAKIGKADSSLWWRKLQMQLRDSLFRDQQYNHIRDLNVASEVQNADAKLQRSENRRRTITVALTVTAIASAVILALLILILMKNRKLDRQNHDLYRRNSEIMRMNENERKMRTSYERRITECEAEIDRLASQSPEQPPRKAKDDPMDEAARQNLLEKIAAAMDDVGLISRNNFSIEQLSKLIGSNSHYVSQVINENYGKNFSSVLGEARVRQACKRLCDDTVYGNLTIEAIASELGFRSRSNFVTVFKKVTGLTPSEYKKISKENLSRQDDKRQADLFSRQSGK